MKNVIRKYLIKSSTNGKSPWENAFTVEFYTCFFFPFFDIIGEVGSQYYLWKRPSRQEGVIILIPKEEDTLLHGDKNLETNNYTSSFGL